MNTKKIILWSIVAIVVLVGVSILISVFYKDTSGSKALETKILTVGVPDDAPTTIEEVSNNGVAAFNYTMVSKIAENLGMELKFVKCSYNKMYSSLNSNDIDCYCSNVIFDEYESEAEKVIYSVPYLNTKTIMVKRKSDSLRIDGIEGKIQLGYVGGDHTYFKYLCENSKDFYLRSKFDWKEYNTFDEMYGDLMSKSISAVVDTEVYYNLRTLSNNAIDIVKDSKQNAYYFDNIKMGLVFNRYSTDLKDAVNSELKKLSKSGYLKQIANQFIKESVDCLVDLS